MPDFFIHKTSVVDDDVQIGEGTKIWHFTHLLSNTKIETIVLLGKIV